MCNIKGECEQINKKIIRIKMRNDNASVRFGVVFVLILFFFSNAKHFLTLL